MRYIFLAFLMMIINNAVLANATIAIFFKDSAEFGQIDALTEELLVNAKQAPEAFLAMTVVKYYPELNVLIGPIQPGSELLTALKLHPDVDYVNLVNGGIEELTTSAAAIYLRTDPLFPIDVARPYPKTKNDVEIDASKNWWAHGYTGQETVTGLLDSGIAAELPAFKDKKVIQYKQSSIYDHYTNGVRTPHGTGVGSILSGGNTEQSYLGIAHGSDTIVFAHAWDSSMECTTEDGTVYDAPCVIGTLDSLLWMLDQNNKPDVVNYSFGNGDLTDDYSIVARLFDHIIEYEDVLIIKSAGNGGYIAPELVGDDYANTLSAPADFYNGLTVANMNTTLEKNSANDDEFLSTLKKTADRDLHSINYTSSRGPTLTGRRKPDLTAPGNDARVYAPNPKVYVNDDNEYFSDYSASMHYRKLDSTRLMGGTSAASPHVAGAVLLLKSYGIRNPMAVRALLINSADAWNPETIDNPCDSSSAACPKGPISIPNWDDTFGYWDRTYGWGYLNLQKAFQQKDNIIIRKLDNQSSTHVYYGQLNPYEKATLVWEKHSGRELITLYFKIETMDEKGETWERTDPSFIDNVKQLINEDDERRRFKITISKPFDAPDESYALVTSSPFAQNIRHP